MNALSAELLRALQAEALARRVAREHPDPSARQVYRSIAERAERRVRELGRRRVEIPEAIW